MNLTELEQKLLAAARAHSPSDAVPYAFEKRIMARLAAVPRVDLWAFWSRALWRAAAPCLAIMVLLSVWSFFSASGASFDNPSEELETTVLAGINQIGQSW
jgi:hypothetical protein